MLDEQIVGAHDVETSQIFLSPFKPYGTGESAAARALSIYPDKWELTVVFTNWCNDKWLVRIEEQK